MTDAKSDGGLSQGEEPSGFYADLLIRDIREALMPMMGRSESGEPCIVLEPANADSEAKFASALRGTASRASAFAPAIAEFVRGCANEVVTHGYAAYEIRFVRHTKGGSEEASIEYLPPGSYVRRGAMLEQSRWPGHQLEAEPTTRRIPVSHVLMFYPPEPWRRRWQKLIATLAAIGQERHSEFTIAMVRPSLPGDTEERIPFDYSQYRRTELNAVAETTRSIGWNPGTVFENQTDYHFVWRHLRFQRFKAELRDGILTTLNDTWVNLLAPFYRASSVLKLQHVPTVTLIDEALLRLQRGDASFKEILEGIRL